jgi:hypothetical protein
MKQKLFMYLHLPLVLILTYSWFLQLLFILWLSHNKLNMFLVVNVELSLSIIVSVCCNKHGIYNNIFIKL